MGMNRPWGSIQLVLLSMLLLGCDRTPQAAISSAYAPSPDQDVTTSARFNFTPFAGTVWKTKVKTAIADIKRYTGAIDTKLLAPSHFDPSDPQYTPIKDLKVLAELPVGTRLRITRLLQDQGAGGNVEVEAVILDGANADRAVRVDGAMVHDTEPSNAPKIVWGAAPNMLEKAN
jgi:hypothetical protein